MRCRGKEDLRGTGERVGKVKERPQAVCRREMTTDRKIREVRDVHGGIQTGRYREKKTKTLGG